MQKVQELSKNIKKSFLESGPSENLKYKIMAFLKESDRVLDDIRIGIDAQFEENIPHSMDTKGGKGESKIEQPELTESINWIRQFEEL